jgi:hypothetical protein
MLLCFIVNIQNWDETIKDYNYGRLDLGFEVYLLANIDLPRSPEFILEPGTELIKK